MPRPAGGGPHAVENTMFRALAVLRVVVLVNSVLIFLVHRSEYARPGWGALIMVGLGLWTAFALWAYDDPARRHAPLLLVDLAVAVGTILLTEWVKGPGFNGTLPGFWVMGVLMAWAVHWRWLGGLVVALVISTADLSVREGFTQTDYGNIFLLCVGGPIMGFTSGLLQQMAADRDRALRAAAAAGERARLGRVVHDGVLQVLALVQRRGTELGGPFGELGQLAGEQEVSLRNFIQHDATALVELEVDPTTELDLTEELARLQRPSVSMALPGDPFLLPAATVVEVVAVVDACLSNVRHHVGTDAPAWVLLEDEGSHWTVSVRDDGPGIDTGRLEAAVADGRMGVSSSIRGRVRDLGGEATLHTAPGQGTEWEFRFPR